MTQLVTLETHRSQLSARSIIVTLAIFVPISLCAACGGGDSPSSPTAPTSTGIRTVFLSPGSIDLAVGGSAFVSATATYTDGSARSVGATWSSSNPSALSVDQSGMVRALSAGTATITATVSGVSGSLIARSNVNVAGRWSGQYKFLSCSAPPRWGGSYCAGTAGVLYNVELILGVTGSQVSGSFRTGNYIGSITGTVAPDGTLALAGSYSYRTPSGLVYTEEIRNWQTRVNGTAMTGRWDTIGLLTGESQTGYNQYEMVTVNKS